jgi:hypothetical protein
MDSLGIEVGSGSQDLVFRLVQVCTSATGKPLTDDEGPSLSRSVTSCPGESVQYPPICTVMILSARSAGGAPNRLLWVRSAWAAVVCAGLVCPWSEVTTWAQSL